MSTDPITSIEAAVVEADALLHRQLAGPQLAVPHLVIAMAPSGAAVFRSNVDADGLEIIARRLLEAAALVRGAKPIPH